MQYIWQGFWYFAEKKEKFRGIFRGKFAGKLADFAGFSRKNRPISRDIRRRKSKFAEKSADFPNFSGKSQILKDFHGQKNRPISREISGVNFAKKQSVKNGRFRWIFFGKFH